MRLAQKEPKLTNYFLWDQCYINLRLSLSTIKRSLKGIWIGFLLPYLVTTFHSKTYTGMFIGTMAKLVETFAFGNGCTDPKRIDFYVTDGRASIWYAKGSEYHQLKIQQEVPFGGISVMIGGGGSSLTVVFFLLQSNFINQRYQEQVFERVILPYCNDHSFTSHPIFKDSYVLLYKACTIYCQWHSSIVCKKTLY